MALRNKILCCLLTIFILGASVFSSIAAENPSFSWYCKRTKDHTQPTLPTEFLFIQEENAYYVDTQHSNPNAEEKVIYLTFDAGYENGNVAKILDILNKNHVPAAFFILTHLVDQYPDLVQRMAEEGHLICNHTSKHKDMSKMANEEDFKNEIEALEIFYRQKTGKEIAKFFRPPEGKFNRQTLKNATALGYTTIFWSFAYADWDNKNQMAPSAAKKKILDHIHNGEILLLHPTSSTNVAILDDVIQTLKADGYRFASLNELSKA
ncbi:MAG: polysaccharide deacetylase family protein [Clostridia bacterium]|nr:polysaccharide deacetylase family protein [Clostridia bacterium]